MHSSSANSTHEKEFSVPGHVSPDSSSEVGESTLGALRRNKPARAVQTPGRGVTTGPQGDTTVKTGDTPDVERVRTCFMGCA